MSVVPNGGCAQAHLAQLVAERGEAATGAKRVQEENARLEKQLGDARRKVRVRGRRLTPTLSPFGTSDGGVSRTSDDYSIGHTNQPRLLG